MSLTIPATMAQCVRRRVIVHFGRDLLEFDEEQRVWLYGTPTFLHWYDEVLPYLAAAPDCEITPLEEVESFLRVLMTSKRASGQLARLQPTRQGVWEAKPHQTRLFGWFPEPLHLVFVRGTEVKLVKDPGGPGYEPFRQEVIRVRKESELDYVGGDLTHVLATARSG